MSLLFALPLRYLNVTENTDILEALSIEGRPTAFPELKENEIVICGSVSKERENMELLFVCNSLNSMQETYVRLHLFLKETLHWYLCKNSKELPKRFKDGDALVV